MGGVGVGGQRGEVGVQNIIKSKKTGNNQEDIQSDPIPKRLKHRQ